MSHSFLFSRVSDNIKTGKIPVTITSSDSCPSVCPLRDNNTCYGKIGPLNWVWNRVTKNNKEKKTTSHYSFDSLLNNLRELPNNELVRHNQVGDLVGKNNSINQKMLKRLIAASNGKRVFTYTHKPVIAGQTAFKTIKANRKAIKEANQKGFTVNLSANSPDEVDSLLKLKIGPVVTVAPIECKETFYTKGGAKIIKCPATYRDGVTCKTCKLCSVSNRSVVIAFPAHGVKKNLLNDTFKITS